MLRFALHVLRSRPPARRAVLARAPGAGAGLLLVLCSSLGAAAGSPVDGEVFADLSGLSIEELMDVEVVSASRHEQSQAAAPSAVSVITADEIRLHGWRTLVEALATVPGLYTAYDRNYHYVGVRGILRPGDFGSRVLILTDGRRVNDPLYNQGPVGREFPLDLALVERIEIVHGPGSSLYGTNALLAVVNVVTKSAADARGVEFAAGAAGGHAAFGRVSWGAAGPRGSVLFSGSLSESAGRTLHFEEYDDPATNNGYTTADTEDRESAFARVTHGDLTVQAAYSTRTKGIPTGAWGTVFCDERNRALDRMTLVNLAWESGTPETLAVTARAHYGEYRYEGDYVFDDGDGTYTNHDRAEGRWWGDEVLLVRRLGDGLLVSIGGEYWNNMRLDQENWNSDGTVLLDSRESSSTWGVYAEGEIALTQRVVAHAGVRYDHCDTFGGDWNPRLSVVCSPTDRTTVKVMYGSAFRAPSPYEMYYHDGGTTQKPSRDLGPESVTSVEAVVDHRIGRALRAAVSVFRMRLDDLIGLTTDPDDSLMVFLNMDRAESRGVEVQLERRSSRGWSGRASYSFQDARDAATDARLTGSPQHLAKLVVTGPLSGDALTGALEVQYVGERPTVRGGMADGCVVVNADVTAGSADSAWALSAGVDNLFDAARDDPGSEEHPQDSIRQDGRTLRIELERVFR